MKRFLLLWTLGMLMALPFGCTTKKSAQQNQRAAFAAGRQTARLELQQNQAAENAPPVITFSGAVRNASIPWREDLSLSRAIVEAGHDSRRNPRAIFVHRGSDVFQIPAWRLMHGEDFQVEPGDHIEIRQ